MTILEIINIAKYSQPLALISAEDGGLFGGGLDLKLSRKIHSVRKNVEWLYDLDPTNSTLTKTANFLYSLCAPFNLRAAASITGGGAISPAISNNTPTPYEFVVDGSSFIPTGGLTVTISSFIGYNVLFVRNNLTQSIINNGGTYFSWNKITGVFSIVGAAAAGELFQIYPFV